MTERSSLPRRLLRLFRRVAAEDRAATAVEYGLIVSLIVIVMLVTFIELAKTTTGMWNNVSNQVAAAR